MKKLTVLFTALLAIALSSCHKDDIEGNNHVVTETFYIDDVEEIANEDIFQVILIRDNQSMIEIEAESNLIPFIEMRVSDGNSLRLYSHEDLEPNEPIRIYVHVREITDLSVSGSGSLTALGFNAPYPELRVSGSGLLRYQGLTDGVFATLSGSGRMLIETDSYEITGKISGSGIMEWRGHAENANYNISGSGTMEALDMEVNNCDASISGSGDMYVNPWDYLHAYIAGSGNVYYLNSPVIESHIIGSGHVWPYNK